MALMREDGSWLQNTSKVSNSRITGDPLAILYNEGMWQMNRVSPLYNLQYTHVNLKKTGAQIRQAIVAAVPATSAKYTVAFEELSNLKYSEDDAGALAITVSSIVDKRKSKVAYMAVLLSWGASDSCEMTTHLPYMLERGEQRVGVAVKSTLQQLYDCSIRQINFTQHQLLQFGFNFVECSTSSQSSEPFTLTFKTQALLKDKLNVSLECGDINIIWNGIRDETMKQSELVNLAYQILQNQIFEMINLDITLFEVSEIRLPKAEIKNNGGVKMKTPEIVNSVFTVLNEITDFMFKADSCSAIDMDD